ncbi:MAG TPA: PKD domain-containing protein [Solirubrobacteraceae bacterium]|nr:PKD domain-containing protein [Solirubrobacteraceae bacterium]
MPRLGRRRSLIIAAATLALLVAPAAANAATYTIKSGDGACGPGDAACGGFAEAAAIAVSGDVFNVAPGIYAGAEFAAPGITINGAAGVLVSSTLTFSGAGDVNKVSKVAVVQTAAGGPAIVVIGSAGLELSDAVAISAHDHAIFISAGQTNKIVRSVVATGGALTNAIRVQSEQSSGPKSLTVESTLASGGDAAISAVTQSAPLLPGAAGDITLVLRHVTAAGASKGVFLDSSAGANALNDGVGNIAATMTDSISLNNSVTRAVGVLGIGDNSATLDTSARNLTSGDPKAIFADPSGGNFRLRPGSPAIGQGSVVPGESPTDIDGEDRSTPPTDLGGDEFSNAPPVAKIAVKTATPRATQPIEFDASGSSDREASYGGGIVLYQWTFSDGKTQTTQGPTVSHAFPKEGDASAQVVVVDRQGASSAPASVALKLVDGTPPTVAIVKPKNNQRIRQFTVNKKTRKRTRTKIVIGGLSRDASGVARIALTIEKLTSSKSCYWYNPRKGFVRRSCKKPILISARLIKDSSTGEWTYTVKRRLTKGRYRIQAVGIDKTGSSGNAGGSKLGVVRFRLI